MPQKQTDDFWAGAPGAPGSPKASEPDDFWAGAPGLDPAPVEAPDEAGGLLSQIRRFARGSGVSDRVIEPSAAPELAGSTASQVRRLASGLGAPVVGPVESLGRVNEAVGGAVKTAASAALQQATPNIPGVLDPAAVIEPALKLGLGKVTDKLGRMQDGEPLFDTKTRGEVIAALLQSTNPSLRELGLLVAGVERTILPQAPGMAGAITRGITGEDLYSVPTVPEPLRPAAQGLVTGARNAPGSGANVPAMLAALGSQTVEGLARAGLGTIDDLAVMWQEGTLEEYLRTRLREIPHAPQTLATLGTTQLGGPPTPSSQMLPEGGAPNRERAAEQIRRVGGEVWDEVVEHVRTPVQFGHLIATMGSIGRAHDWLTGKDPEGLDAFLVEHGWDRDTFLRDLEAQPVGKILELIDVTGAIAITPTIRARGKGKQAGGAPEPTPTPEPAPGGTPSGAELAEIMSPDRPVESAPTEEAPAPSKPRKSQIKAEDYDTEADFLQARRYEVEAQGRKWTPQLEGRLKREYTDKGPKFIDLTDEAQAGKAGGRVEPVPTIADPYEVQQYIATNGGVRFTGKDALEDAGPKQYPGLPPGFFNDTTGRTVDDWAEHLVEVGLFEDTGNAYDFVSREVLSASRPKDYLPSRKLETGEALEAQREREGAEALRKKAAAKNIDLSKREARKIVGEGKGLTDLSVDELKLGDKVVTANDVYTVRRNTDPAFNEFDKKLVDGDTIVPTFDNPTVLGRIEHRAKRPPGRPRKQHDLAGRVDGADGMFSFYYTKGEKTVRVEGNNSVGDTWEGTYPYQGPETKASLSKFVRRQVRRERPFTPREFAEQPSPIEPAPAKGKGTAPPAQKPEAEAPAPPAKREGRTRAVTDALTDKPVYGESGLEAPGGLFDKSPRKPEPEAPLYLERGSVPERRPDETPQKGNPSWMEAGVRKLKAARKNPDSRPYPSSKRTNKQEWADFATRHNADRVAEVARRVDDMEAARAGDKNVLVTKKSYEKAKKDLKKSLFRPNAGAPLDGIPAAVKIAVHHAERYARVAKTGRAAFRPWAKAVRKTLLENIEGLTEITNAQLRRLWKHPRVRVARERIVNAMLDVNSMGMERFFQKALNNAERGSALFHEWRQGRNRLNLALRLIDEDTAARFGIDRRRFRKNLERIPKDLKRDLWVAAGTVRRNRKGNLEYGAIQRAGAYELSKDAELRAEELDAMAPGTMLEDGRITGQLDPSETYIQLYRVITDKEARAAHDRVKANKVAAEALEKFIAISEELNYHPQVQETLPAFARGPQKAQYDIEGLTEAELKEAAFWAKRAYGRNADVKIPVRWNIAPTVGLKGYTDVGRLRNALRPTVASTRRFQTGTIHEMIYNRALSADLARATKATRSQLIREELHNQTAAKMLHLAARPIRGNEPDPGWVALGDGARMRKLLERRRPVFEAAGIDVEAALKASRKAEGKSGWQVPAEVAQVVTNLLENNRKVPGPIANLADDMVTAINTWRLSRPSSAFRNLLGNQIIYSARVLRDLYEAVLLTAMPSAKAHPAMNPWANVGADLRAIGAALGSTSRRQIPPEMLGATIYDELVGTPTTGARREVPYLGAAMRRSRDVGGTWLRYNGFMAADIYTKRVNYEATIDATSRQALAIHNHNQRKHGRPEVTGKDKAAWRERWKEDLPKEIEQVAYRDMDLWGGYDYANIPQWLRALKGIDAQTPVARGFGTVGRGLVPYPTYYYKLAMTHWELFGTQTRRRAFGRNVPRAQRIRAWANLLAGGTMYGLAYAITAGLGDDEPLPKGVLDSDLPLESQRFGRLRIPSSERWGIDGADDGLWVRMYDLPFLGDWMAARAMWRGNITPGDYLNDRFSLGPLFHTPAMLMGLSTRYNKDQTLSSKLGREGAPYLFPPGMALTNELQLARRLTDPKKRETSRKDRAPLWNYFAALGDNYPFVTRMTWNKPLIAMAEAMGEKAGKLGEPLIKPRTQTSQLKQPQYHWSEALLSYAVINMRAQNKSDRDTAVAYAHMALTGEERAQAAKDVLSQEIREQVGPGGRTAAGEIRRKAGATQAERGRVTARDKATTAVLQGIHDGDVLDLPGLKAVIADWRQRALADPKGTFGVDVEPGPLSRIVRDAADHAEAEGKEILERRRDSLRETELRKVKDRRVRSFLRQNVF